MEGVRFKHPFADRESIIRLAKFVTTDEGTGIVHIAPGHGREDYVLGKEVGLDIYSPVDEKGQFTAEAEGFEGLTTEDASRRVIEILEDKGSLVHTGKIQHNNFIPFCSENGSCSFPQKIYG